MSSYFVLDYGVTMSKPSDFDLQTFQSEVIKEYNLLQKIFDSAFGYSDNSQHKKMDDSKKKRNLFRAFISTSFFKIISSIEKKSLHLYLKKPDIVEYKEKAKSIVFDGRINKILCPILLSKITSDMLEEEMMLEVIKIITQSLTEEEVIEKFSINLDPVLFAFIVYEITRRRVENYCRKQ